MMPRSVSLPMTDDVVASLRAGERLLLSGRIIAARDETHRRLVDLKKNNKAIPVDLKGQIIYYVGPSPTKPGKIIGSAGPTTAKRMDKYTKDMLELGVVGMIGKGERGRETKELLKGKAIYMAALGGTGALLSHHVTREELITFADSGMEALRSLEVKDFPVIVIHDLQGSDGYEMLRKEWRRG